MSYYHEHLHLTVLVLLSLLLQSALSDDAYDYVWLGEPRPARAAMGSGSGDTTFITVIDYNYPDSDATHPVNPSSTVVRQTSASLSAVVLTSASSSTFLLLLIS